MEARLVLLNNCAQLHPLLSFRTEAMLVDRSDVDGDKV